MKLSTQQQNISVTTPPLLGQEEKFQRKFPDDNQQVDLENPKVELRHSISKLRYVHKSEGEGKKRKISQQRRQNLEGKKNKLLPKTSKAQQLT